MIYLADEAEISTRKTTTLYSLEFSKVSRVSTANIVGMFPMLCHPSTSSLSLARPFNDVKQSKKPQLAHSR